MAESPEIQLSHLSQATKGLLVEAHRALLVLRATGRTLDNAIRAESAAKQIYERLAGSVAVLIDLDTATGIEQPMSPHDPALRAAAEAAWQEEIGRAAAPDRVDLTPMQSETG